MLFRSVKRREFLKILGATGATTAVVGCSSEKVGEIGVLRKTEDPRQRSVHPEEPRRPELVAARVEGQAKGESKVVVAEGVGKVQPGFSTASIITGESKPRTACIGDIVHAGSIALTGPIEIDVIAAADWVIELGPGGGVAEPLRAVPVRLRFAQRSRSNSGPAHGRRARPAHGK